METKPQKGCWVMGKEQRLKTAWIKKLPENVPRWEKVRLGEWHDKSKAKIASVMLKYADLIYIQDNAMHICEFKVRNQINAIGQLLTYKLEIIKTTELAPYYPLPIKLYLIVPFIDNVARMAAQRYGIEYEVFDGNS